MVLFLLLLRSFERRKKNKTLRSFYSFWFLLLLVRNRYIHLFEMAWKTRNTWCTLHTTANRQNCLPGPTKNSIKCTKSNPAQWKLVMHAECTERANTNEKKNQIQIKQATTHLSNWRGEWIRKSQIVSNRNWLNFWFVRYRVRFSGCNITLKKTVHIFGPKTENTQHTYTDAHIHNIYVSGVHSFNVVIKFIYSLGRFHSNLKQVHACIPHDLCIDS